MTPKDIAQIIKCCKNAGIAEFRLDNLYLKFRESAEPQAMPTLTESEALTELERKLAQDDDLQQLHLQNLMIEDPLAYEEMRRSNAANY